MAQNGSNCDEKVAKSGPSLAEKPQEYEEIVALKVAKMAQKLMKKWPKVT